MNTDSQLPNPQPPEQPRREGGEWKAGPVQFHNGRYYYFVEIFRPDGSVFEIFYPIREGALQIAAQIVEDHNSSVRLLNLLARIHRDGGHYIAQHGLEKACIDADIIVANLNAQQIDG